jgi:hypothetical protein
VFSYDIIKLKPEDVDAYGRRVLEWGERVPMIREHGTESLGPVKVGEFLDKLSE